MLNSRLGKALRFADESKGLVRFGRNVCLSWGFAQSLNRPALFFLIAVVVRVCFQCFVRSELSALAGTVVRFPIMRAVLFPVCF